MKKNLLVCFLLMALCLQCLPWQLLKQNTSLQQYSNQVTLDEDEVGCIKVKETARYYLDGSMFDLTNPGLEKLINSKFVSHAIPLNHSVDIHVPPPNC